MITKVIPPAYVAVVLALAGHRLMRLVGWDDLPPIARAREWLTQTRVETTGSPNARMNLTREQPDTAVVHGRPLLAHFLACSFCAGFWIAVLIYVSWRLEPTWTVTLLAPFALSSVIGLVSKNLDP